MTILRLPSAVVNRDPSEEAPLVIAHALSQIFRKYRIAVSLTWIVAFGCLALLLQRLLGIGPRSVAWVLFLLVILFACLVARCFAFPLLLRPRLVSITKLHAHIRSIPYSATSVFLHDSQAPEIEFWIGPLDTQPVSALLEHIPTVSEDPDLQADFVREIAKLRDAVLRLAPNPYRATFLARDSGLVRDLLQLMQDSGREGFESHEGTSPTDASDKMLLPVVQTVRRFATGYQDNLQFLQSVSSQAQIFRSAFAEQLAVTHGDSSTYLSGWPTEIGELQSDEFSPGTAEFAASAREVYEEAIAEMEQVVKPLVDGIDNARKDRQMAIQARFKEDVQQRKSSCEKRIADLEAERRRIARECELLSDECSKWNKILHSASAEAARLRNEQKSMKKEIKDKQHLHEVTLEGITSEDIHNLGSTLPAEKRAKLLYAEIRVLKIRLDELTPEIDAAEERVSVTTARAEDARERLNQKKSDLEDIVGNIKDLQQKEQKEVARLEEQCRSSVENISKEAAQEIANTRGHIVKFQEELRGFTRNISDSDPKDIVPVTDVLRQRLACCPKMAKVDPRSFLEGSVDVILSAIAKGLEEIKDRCSLTRDLAESCRIEIPSLADGGPGGIEIPFWLVECRKSLFTASTDKAIHGIGEVSLGEKRFSSNALGYQLSSEAFPHLQTWVEGYARKESLAGILRERNILQDKTTLDHLLLEGFSMLRDLKLARASFLRFAAVRLIRSASGVVIDLARERRGIFAGGILDRAAKMNPFRRSR